MPVLLWAAAWSDAGASAPPRTLRFEQLGVEHGLVQESVLAIAQDRQGFMWFGSQAGLSRYDGYRVISFKSAVADPASLGDNWVRALYTDRAGGLWVGTDGGLDHYDAQTQTFTHYRPDEAVKRGNGNRHVRAILDDGLGGLWLATGDGLQHFDPANGRFTIWHHDAADGASLADDQVNALARDAAGRLWVGTASGLDMLAPRAAGFVHHRLDTTPDDKSNAVQALQVDATQTLWIGTLAGLEQWSRLDAAQPLRRARRAQAGQHLGPLPGRRKHAVGGQRRRWPVPLAAGRKSPGPVPPRIQRQPQRRRQPDIGAVPRPPRHLLGRHLEQWRQPCRSGQRRLRAAGAPGRPAAQPVRQQGARHRRRRPRPALAGHQRRPESLRSGQRRQPGLRARSGQCQQPDR